MLYLHIPFCKTRCSYCDFYSTTFQAEVRARYVDALICELRAEKHFLPTTQLPTLYLGGGTPSQLSEADLTRLLQAVNNEFRFTFDAELTIEANPDDVTPEWARMVCRLGFNRVSLGVQSFDDALLRLLNRRHTARQVERAIDNLHQAGIDNISIDLMYGLPQQSLSNFRKDVMRALQLPICHLSSYALTVEKGTKLWRQVTAGELTPADEELTRSEYQCLLDLAEQAGWEHYEISNFARHGYFSRHNSSYWTGTPYLGCGAAAHSFDGKCLRRYNLPDLKAYIQHPAAPPRREEHLSTAERFDEMVFTALRTRAGLSLERAKAAFPAYFLQLMQSAQPHIAAGRLALREGNLCLTRSALFISDSVMSDLMHV